MLREAEVVTASIESLSSDELQRGWNDAHVKPLWEIAQAHAPDGDVEPPMLWAWRTMEPLVQRAIALASPASAERRVLALIDPQGREGDFHTAPNLNAALQILLPGERARPHRHSMEALRFVLEGDGAVTRVDAVEAPMAFGDLVLTPAWCWHEHWHAGSEPMVWLDVLNVHTHLHLGTFSFEPGPPHDVPAAPPAGAFAFAGMLPDVAASGVSPVFRYTLADAKRALAAAPPASDGAYRVRYINPQNGGPVMPLLDCYLVRLDAGQTTLPVTTNAHTVCAVVEGNGETIAGSARVAGGERDIFTLPPRATIVHRAAEPAYVFMVTDREVLRRLGLLRETTLVAGIAP
jgi:gentisate 1,2-dioxygenase